MNCILLCLAVAASAPTDAAASWELRWDDQIDGVLAGAPKSCDVKLTVINGRITGGFEGLVLGEKRTATFIGEALGMDQSLVLLQQHEPGYVCAYQLVRVSDALMTGVWHDTKGRRGDVILKLKVASRAAPPERRPDPLR